METPSNPDDPNLVPAAAAAAAGGKETARARRRREEAVRRLVADIQSRSDRKYGAAEGQPTRESQDWIVASAVAAALERGLEQDLCQDLVLQSKENVGRIGQVCHDHSDVFLASVGKVVALGTPSSDLANKLTQAQAELEKKTAGPMHDAALLWESAAASHARAKALHTMVGACQKVAMHIARARKQAALGRPRGALEAVDEARNALTSPMSSLFAGPQMEDAMQILQDAARKKQRKRNGANDSEAKIMSLEETPFGRRASLMLPKIENEVLLTARRGLNKWFLALRSGGDGAKAGRAVLRRCANSMAIGPGNLGLGGHVPPSYVWRAKVSDNLIARLNQNGRVVRAVRLGYWYERDAAKDAEQLESRSPGMERRAEAFAAAFGWYRCWDENASLLVDPSDYAAIAENKKSAGDGSDGGSRQGGMGGSRHGRGTSLGFRASGRSNQGLATASNAKKARGDGRSKWAALLTPEVLFENSPTKTDDDNKLEAVAESVHPVRRAEIAFKLLGRDEEFVQNYEQNRFGEVQISGDSKDGKSESPRLSSLTGDDVSVGTDRIFFAKSLPHLCSSVVGFSAVEAALELGHFGEEDEEEKKKGADPGTAKAAVATRFRESSERYERNLVTELGNCLRTRAVSANLPELVRASCLMAAFRSALKVVHPSSSTRRLDKNVLAMEVDVIINALKVAKDEQLKATIAVVTEDSMEPIPAPPKSPPSSDRNVPKPEVIGLPFGLYDLRQQNKGAGGRSGGLLSFSNSVPMVLRSIHARAIACAAFALSQEELGQKFLQKRGSNAACYVLDCAEYFVTVAAVGMKDTSSSKGAAEEVGVKNAVQTMANITALQASLPRLWGTLMRGLCHVGMIRSDQLAATFEAAEITLKNADKQYDNQMGSMFTSIYEICRSRIDAHLNYALDGFNWVAKSARNVPNPYCEGLIGYMKGLFDDLGPMDEGSRAGLHFSCCGHVSERLVKILSERPVEGSLAMDGGLPPISRIDAFGLKNLSRDVQEFRMFAKSTGVPQLAECFDELKSITDAMLDKDLPILLQPENSSHRKKKYEYLSLEKVGNILEKYQGSGGLNLMGSGRVPDGMLVLDKKEVTSLLRLVHSHGI